MHSNNNSPSASDTPDTQEISLDEASASSNSNSSHITYTEVIKNDKALLFHPVVMYQSFTVQLQENVMRYCQHVIN